MQSAVGVGEDGFQGLPEGVGENGSFGPISLVEAGQGGRGFGEEGVGERPCYVPFSARRRGECLLETINEILQPGIAPGVFHQSGRYECDSCHCCCLPFFIVQPRVQAGEAAGERALCFLQRFPAASPLVRLIYFVGGMGSFPGLICAVFVRIGLIFF